MFGAIARDPAEADALLCGRRSVATALHFYVKERLEEGAADLIHGTNALICVVSVISYLIGIFSGTIIGKDELGVLAVWMFCSSRFRSICRRCECADRGCPARPLFLVTSRMAKTAGKVVLRSGNTLAFRAGRLYVSASPDRRALRSTT